MRSTIQLAAIVATVAATAALTVTPASAACTRLGFSVNDYGKDGPTKDAKELLDKYIAKTMSEKGIKKYTTGKKDVKCDLFLNFIVFDEHTCRAEATVCWDGAPLPKGETVAGATGAAEKPAATKATAPKATAAKTDDAKKPIETSSTTKSTPKADAPAKAAEPAKAVEKAVEKTAPADAKPAKAAQ